MAMMMIHGMIKKMNLNSRMKNLSKELLTSTCSEKHERRQLRENIFLKSLAR